MITCTSERSGNASTGVLMIVHVPQTLRNKAPIITRKRLATERRIIHSIIIVSLMARMRVVSFFRMTHALQRTANIGFGVNQEQTADHDSIAFVQSAANRGLLLRFMQNMN